MELNFDLRGLLHPIGKNTLSTQEFKQFFVDPFPTSSTRHSIYEDYLRYTKDFSKEVNHQFVQWINGSFVTKKLNPRDIDLVTILDHKCFEEKEAIIHSKFRMLNGRKLYNVDAYTVRKYPEDHKKHSIFHGELLYWDNWFSWTKKNRAKKKFQKGFIEIQFD